MNLPQVSPLVEAEAKQWLQEKLGWTDADFDDVGMIYGERIETLLAAFGEWHQARCIPCG